jgi:hypothetical protein
MKPIKLVALASWMLEHLTFGPRNEALSGDLLEELRYGRSGRWYWHQVLTAIGIGLWKKTRECAVPLVFAAGWSTLYPLWKFVGRDWLTQVAPDRWATLEWPYSSSLQIVNGVIPAVTFVWLGLLVYLISRARAASGLSPFRLVQSLSTSLSVLLVATIWLLHHLSHPGLDLHYVTRDDFYSSVHFFTIGIPLTLSLLVAILSALPRIPQLARRQRLNCARTKTT